MHSKEKVGRAKQGLNRAIIRVYADHATVDKFYEVAIAAGGKDNGKPGIRQMYGPHYYGAVRDVLDSSMAGNWLTMC